MKKTNKIVYIRDFFLNQKIAEAIKFIKEYEPPEGYLVAFSGGKDSIVVLDLVRKSGAKHIVIYNNTMIDPPEVQDFIRKEYPEVIWINPKITFWQGILKFGVPSAKRRWCCRILKETDTEFTKKFSHKILGVRAQESWKRARRKRIDVIGKRKKKYLLKPVFYWKTEDIWDYIQKNNLNYPSLYDEGIERIGCIVCPLMGKKQREKYMKRYPKYFENYNRFAMMYYEQNKDKLDYERFVSYLYKIEK